MLDPSPTPTTHRAPRWPRRLVFIGLALLLAAAVVVLALALLSRPASATVGVGGPTGGQYVGEVVPGSACEHEGDRGTKNDKSYRCVQKPGEDCPHWHRVVVPGEPVGSWSPRPVGPCPRCSPSPSASESPSASPSMTPLASPSEGTGGPGGGSTPGGGGLPVTGPAVLVLVALGFGLVGGGWLLRRAGRVRRTVPNSAG